MNINEHELLLESWAARPHHSKKGFVKDGIIDPARWNTTSIKVLFLLKEAYPDEPHKATDWDLRILLKENWKKPKGVLFRRAACWAYAAKHFSDPIQPQLPADDNAWSEAGECLLSAAIVNVKKSCGKNSSDLEDIKMHAQVDGEFLKRQIELIMPNIVICGYTWFAVQHLWPGAEVLYHRSYQADKKVFIDFWHPANRYPNDLNYYTLTSLLRHPAVDQAITNR